jgi:hypothetical protein
MPRLPSFVTRVDTAHGVRYEARINTTLSTGTRLQQRKRFASLEEAKTWHSTTTAALSFGTFTAPSEVTVKQAVEAWLKAKSARVKQTTAEAYTAALRPVVDQYHSVIGHFLSQKVSVFFRSGAGSGMLAAGAGCAPPCGLA